MRWYRVVVALAVGGCTKTPPPACITVDTSCHTLYQPTFDNVYTMTLAPHCGSTNSGCHSTTPGPSQLSFADEQTAYTELLSPSHLDPKRDRVVPGDPACSLITVRTDSPGQDYQMPPGTPLPPEERCALIQWVAAGAPGPGVGSAR
ncbi:MAG: hypothetical protein ACM31C_05260 [Acidobacteriota bacterium]